MNVRPLAVLHCIYDDPENPWVGGGGARRVHDLYRELAGSVTVTIATGNFPGARDEERGGLALRRIGTARTYPLSRATYAVQASRLLRTARYDVAVVDHSAYAPVLVPRHRPVGITVHHLTGPVAAERWGAAGGALIGRVERAMLRRARVFSATSTATRDALSPIVGDGARVIPVASGVPDALFALPRDDRGYVAYVGRLDARQKGVDVLIDAFAAVVRARPDASLLLVGRGADEGSLRARAAGLGLASHVRFLGALPDDERNRVLAGAALVVAPSRFEGFGISAAESLAAAAPLLVADDPALVEIVGGRSGAAAIVPRNDAAALARTITSLLADPAERSRMSHAGRALAERFRWSAVAADHLHFLRQIVLHSEARRDQPVIG